MANTSTKSAPNTTAAPARKGFTISHDAPPTLGKRGRKETAANPEIVALLKETLTSGKAVGVPASELRPGLPAGLDEKQTNNFYGAPIRKAAQEAGTGASSQFDATTGLVWFRGLPKRAAVSA